MLSRSFSQTATGNSQRRTAAHTQVMSWRRGSIPVLPFIYAAHSSIVCNKCQHQCGHSSPSCSALVRSTSGASLSRLQ